MSRFLSQLFRRGKAAEPSPRDLVLAQRERLLGCALQILQDGAAAQEVVLKGLGQALQSPLLVPLSGDGAPPAPAGEPAAIDDAGLAALVRWLDRLIVNLSLSRLRQAAPVRPGSRGAGGDDPTEPRPLMEVLRRGAIPTAPPPLRTAAPPPVQGTPPGGTDASTRGGVPTPLPERATPSGGMPVQMAADVVPPGARPKALLAGPQARSGPPPAPTSRAAGAQRPSGESGPRRAAAVVPAEIQQLERLAQALRGLSPEARVTVTLVTMQGRSLAEVAEVLGCSEASCLYWLRHGRKQLRRALQRDLLDAEPEPPAPSADSPTGVLYDLRRGKKAAARA